jgi:hypothetical protein
VLDHKFQQPAGKINLAHYPSERDALLKALGVGEEAALDGDVAKDEGVEGDFDRFGRLADEDKQAVLAQQAEAEVVAFAHAGGVDDSVKAVLQPERFLDGGAGGLGPLSAIEGEVGRVLEGSDQVERFRTGVDADYLEIEAFGELNADVTERAEADDAESLSGLEVTGLDGAPDRRSCSSSASGAPSVDANLPAQVCGAAWAKLSESGSLAEDRESTSAYSAKAPS